MQQRIKIKHDGPRGWAGIVPGAFDPDRHERYDGGGASVPEDYREAMEARAKSLGIKGAHLMKDETLREKIAAAEASEG